MVALCVLSLLLFPLTQQLPDRGALCLALPLAGVLGLLVPRTHAFSPLLVMFHQRAMQFHVSIKSSGLQLAIFS